MNEQPATMSRDLHDAFAKAMADFNRWRSGPEPTVMFQMRECLISKICYAVIPYEAEPLPPGYLQLLLSLTDDRHSDLKKQLAENYSSAGRYLLQLIDYRKNWHRRRDEQAWRAESVAAESGNG